MNPRNDLNLLISQDEILQKVAEIGKKLDQLYSEKEITIVMVMKGAICFVADLIRHLTVANSLEFIQGSSYGARGAEPGNLSLFGIEQLSISGKHVLLVDDIDESRRFHALKCAFIFKDRYKFVVGYGLDYKEHYRGLPAIYAL